MCPSVAFATRNRLFGRVSTTDYSGCSSYVDVVQLWISMVIVADRRLLHESKRWSNPIKRQGKEGQKPVLQRIVFLARPAFRFPLPLII